VQNNKAAYKNFCNRASVVSSLADFGFMSPYWQFKLFFFKVPGVCIGPLLQLLFQVLGYVSSKKDGLDVRYEPGQLSQYSV
jgi:hypothetical protein